MSSSEQDETGDSASGDMHEAGGLPDAVVFSEMLQDGDGLFLGKTGTGKYGPSTLGEKLSALRTVEEANCLRFTGPATLTEISSALDAEKSTAIILTTEVGKGTHERILQG